MTAPADPSRPTTPWAPIAFTPLPGPKRLRDPIVVRPRPHFTIWIWALGPGTLHLMERQVRLEPCSLVLIPPGVAATAQPERSELQIIEARFDMHLRDRCVRSAARRVDADAWTLRLAGVPALSLIARSAPGGMGDRFLRAARLYADPGMQKLELLSQVCRAMALFREAHVEGPHRLASLPSFAHVAADYLRRHLDAPAISLQDVAHYTGISRTHLARTFRATYRTTPMQYLLEQRMARARTLLEETSLRIGEIAVRVGMPSASHFRRMFRKKHGVAPGAYREARGEAKARRGGGGATR